MGLFVNPSRVSFEKLFRNHRWNAGGLILVALIEDAGEIGHCPEAVVLQFEEVVGVIERLFRESKAHGFDPWEH